MKDFSRILDAWEARGGAVAANKPEAEPSPDPLPSRSTMEKAKANEVLDLHGLLKDAALARVRSTLTQARQGGARKVLLIHGKGLHSDGKSVLKEAVRHLVARTPHVAAWGPASRQEGGEGATWVWLKEDLSVRGR